MSRSSDHPAVGAPLGSREFNGEGLLEELADLREARVRSRQIADCALALKPLRKLAPKEWALQVKQLVSIRFQRTEALAQLLSSWADRVKSPADIDAVTGHFERLALTSALLTALWRGRDRLRAEGESP